MRSRPSTAARSWRAATTTPAKAASSLECTSYSAILKDSVEDSSPKMRSAIRDQCLTKIKRLGEEGIRVP